MTSDWRRYAEVATGLLGWTPEIFWNATPAEFWTAFDGWAKAHGVEGEMEPLSRAEMDVLCESLVRKK